MDHFIFDYFNSSPLFARSLWIRQPPTLQFLPEPCVWLFLIIFFGWKHILIRPKINDPKSEHSNAMILVQFGCVFIYDEEWVWRRNSYAQMNITWCARDTISMVVCDQITKLVKWSTSLQRLRTAAIGNTCIQSGLVCIRLSRTIIEDLLLRETMHTFWIIWNSNMGS